MSKWVYEKTKDICLKIITIGKHSQQQHHNNGSKLDCKFLCHFFQYCKMVCLGFGDQFLSLPPNYISFGALDNFTNMYP